MTVDRPTVYADGAALPFREKSIDFIVLSHVLEHIPEPVPLLEEVQRVGRAGYIETPNVLYERLDPFEIHVLEIRDDAGTLRLRKKPAAIPDRFVGDMRVISDGSRGRLHRFMLTHPEEFHVRYWWKDRISFVVENPDQDVSWFRPAFHTSSRVDSELELPAVPRLRRVARRLARSYYKAQSRRRKQ